MSDIFLSYAREDLEFVSRVHSALESLGFDIVWDQDIPKGADWDQWIRERLDGCKASIVFWTDNSLASDPVRQEAEIARQSGKLVQVTLRDMGPNDYPVGLYTKQSTNLAEWDGTTGHPDFLTLMQELEVKVSPAWLDKRLAQLNQSIEFEKRRRLIAVSEREAANNQLTESLEEVGRLESRIKPLEKDLATSREEAEAAAKQSSDYQRRYEDVSKQPRVTRPMVVASVVLAGLLGIGGFYWGTAGRIPMLEHKTQLDKKDAAYGKQIRSLNDSHDKALGKIKDSQAKTIAEMRKDWEKEKAALTAKYDLALSTKSKTWATERQELSAQHSAAQAAALKLRDTEHQKSLQEALRTERDKLNAANAVLSEELEKQKIRDQQLSLSLDMYKALVEDSKQYQLANVDLCLFDEIKANKKTVFTFDPPDPNTPAFKRLSGYLEGNNDVSQISKLQDYFLKFPLGRVDKRDSHGGLGVIQAGICYGDQLAPTPDERRRVVAV